MPGGAAAVTSGDALCKEVAALGLRLGLLAREQFKCGRRIWGAERYIDVVLTEVSSRRRLGIECKYQGTAGSAEEKIPAIISDITAWPIPGLVVFSGLGFSENIKSFLIASGRAVELDELEPWVQLFFGLELPPTPERAPRRARRALL
ncbi:MAG: PD-(D/E)XK nuclease superfamily protein [Deltaproteobacteria bacterium]